MRRRCQTILEAMERAGYTPGKDIYLGMDVASSEFYRDGRTITWKARASPMMPPVSATISRAWWTAIPFFRSRTAWPKAIGTAGRC